ncbi:MFS transporter [Methanolacinia paynteri]|uniref:MFS transporter n=1 Tax=Methanolacinia paynteri TaxID=230356 RepID=UPI00064ECB17|nr:MFS transporter [Methanolacinia paynteri]
MNILRRSADTNKSHWGVLAIACMAVFIMVIDTTIMNVSISALVADLNTDLPSIQSTIAVYALIMASFMLFGSRMQDIIGRKRAFLFGVLLYGAGTFTASVSWNINSLLIGWSVLEGLGAAFMLPATSAFLTDSYEGKERAFAFGLWGGVGAAGAAFGPIVGGFLTTYYSWRWAFRLELIVVIVIIIFSYLLKERKTGSGWRELDLFGTVLSFGGLSLLVVGILMLRNVFMWDLIPLLIISGIVLLGILYFWLVRRKKNGRMPLVDVDVFKNRTFSIGIILGIIQNLVIAGILFIIPVFLQSVTGATAFLTGFALLPMSLAILVFSISANRLNVFAGPKTLLLAGFAVAIGGSQLLGGVFGLYTEAFDIVPGSVIFGIGVGIIFSQLTNITLSSSSKEHESDASGVLNTSRQLGTSLGTAIIGVLLFISLFGGLIAGLELDEQLDDLSVEEKALQLQEWTYRMGESPLPGSLTPVQAEAIKIIVDDALASAMKTTFSAISIILALGFILVLGLPKRESD